MPRPKGSKNKKTLAAVSAQAATEIDSRIAAVEAEIEELSEKLKARKAELKTLAREKAKADAAAAAKKAEEDKAAILAAVEASGKSLDEILALLK
jgi:uncharacterized protein involved in exopolysaccharide biosynthesis